MELKKFERKNNRWYSVQSREYPEVSHYYDRSYRKIYQCNTTRIITLLYNVSAPDFAQLSVITA